MLSFTIFFHTLSVYLKKIVAIDKYENFKIATANYKNTCIQMSDLIIKNCKFYEIKLIPTLNTCKNQFIEIISIKLENKIRIYIHKSIKERQFFPSE